MVSPFRQASPYIHLGLLVLLFLFCSNTVSSHATSESARGESSSTAAPHQQDLAHETKGDSAHEPDHENEAEHQEGTLAHHSSASESASGESAEPVELVDSVKDFPATLTNGLSSDLNHDGAKIQAIVDVADSSMAHQGVEAGLSNGIPAETAEDSAGKLQKHSSSSGAASKQSHLEVVIDDDDKEDTAHEASSSSSSSSSLAAKATTDAPAQVGKMQRSSSGSTKESGLQPGAVAADEEKKRANELGETWVLPSVQPPGQLLPTPYPYPYPYAYNPLVYPRPLPRPRRLKGGYPALPSVYSYPYPRPVVTTTLSVPYIPYQPEAYRAKEAARDWKVDPQYQKQGKVAVAPSVPVFSAAGTCLNCQFDPSTASASPMIVPFATSMAPVTVLPNGVALQLQHKSTEEEKSSA